MAAAGRVRGAVARAVVAAFAIAFTGCGGSDDDEPPEQIAAVEVEPPLDPLPPAGASRWAAVEFDSDADGNADQITLYTYDDAGRRSTAAVYGAVAGRPDGEPLWHTRRSYDRWGRLAGIIGESAGKVTYSTTYGYGADGRVATQRDVDAEGRAAEYTYSWSDGRLVGFTRASGDGNGYPHVTVTYGDDGFVQSVRSQPAGRPDGGVEEHYRWTADGRLLSKIWLSLDTDEPITHWFTYDADGHHTKTRVSMDGLDDQVAMLSHDDLGRVTEVAYDRPREEAEFVARQVWRYRWETAPCQPIMQPGPPPYEGYILAGEVSPANIPYGCGP